MNLVDQIKGQIPGDVLGRLSAVGDASEEQTGKAVAAAVPGLLSVLAGLAANPEKVETLVSALRSPELETKEGDLLGALLGGGTLSTLIGAVATFASLHPEVVKTLLSELGPIVLSVIAGQLEPRGQNARGLASLFAENASAIKGALPPGFILSGTGQPAAGVPARRKRWRGLAALVVLALIAAGVWIAFGNKGEPVGGPVAEAVVQPPEGPAAPPPTPPAKKDDPAPDAAGLAKNLTETYTSATRDLTEIIDVPTAAAAIPKLQALSAGIKTLEAAWDKLPESARSTVAAVAKDHLPTLQKQVARVLAVPGVSEKLEPLLDALVKRLAGMA
jgi:hypothetical protein